MGRARTGRILIVHYSRSGHTARLADALARELAARGFEVAREEIRVVRDWNKWLLPLPLLPLLPFLPLYLLSGAFRRLWHRHFHQPEQAIRALEVGEIMTLQKALTKISQEVPGQVIKVELEREQGRWVYEFKLLRQGGEQIKLVVNAVNGEVLQTKSKSPKRK